MLSTIALVVGVICFLFYWGIISISKKEFNELENRVSMADSFEEIEALITEIETKNSKYPKKKLKKLKAILNKKIDKIQFKNPIKREFEKVTPAERPYKRELTKSENEIMTKMFRNHSWTKFIDKNGLIILGGGEDSVGEEPDGKFYITEDDLSIMTNIYEQK